MHIYIYIYIDFLSLSTTLFLFHSYISLLLLVSFSPRAFPRKPTALPFFLIILLCYPLILHVAGLWSLFRFTEPFCISVHQLVPSCGAHTPFLRKEGNSKGIRSTLGFFFPQRISLLHSHSTSELRLRLTISRNSYSPIFTGKRMNKFKILSVYNYNARRIQIAFTREYPTEFAIIFKPKSLIRYILISFQFLIVPIHLSVVNLYSFLFWKILYVLNVYIFT